MTTKMTTLSVFAFLGLGLVSYGQTYDGKVGINTSTPNATLEIKISDANKTGTTKEGILIPSVTAERAKAMGTDVAESTLVYIESGAAEVNTTISGVNGKGFYYYDAATSKWTKIGSSSSSDAVLGKTIANIREQQLPMSVSDWQDNDYTVVVKGSGSISLPAASEHKGRIFCVRNGESTNRAYDGNDIPENNGSIGGNRGQILQSDGTFWWVIGGF